MKKVIKYLAITLGLIVFMSTTCDTTNDPTPSCDGIANVTSTGTIDEVFCYDQLTDFYFEEGNQIHLVAVQSEGSTYAFGVDVNTYKLNGTPNLLKTGTYNCGPDYPGSVALIVQGTDQNEYYSSTSGTINISQMSNNSFKATFDVSAVHNVNNTSIHIKGEVNY